MSKNMYVDLHVIQTVPASCVNRDDTGSPKTAIYGGTMRSRVSSQSWKRAMRLMFKDLFDEEQVGIRTRGIANLIAEELLRIDPNMTSENALDKTNKALAAADFKKENAKDVLFFISLPQAKAAASVIAEYDGSTEKKAKKEFKTKLEDALNLNPGVDMVMFGRMAASDPSLNYDAACQVAHTLSTHTVSNEYDYFTAVDDLASDEDSGAGHLGTVEFNSSTMYRYATVNVRALEKNLESDMIPDVVSKFAEAFIRSMPTGKQNTFANRTLPDLVYVTIRNDQPINLAGAFERPVYAKDKGNVEESIQRLHRYAAGVYADYTAAPQASWNVGSDLEGFGQRVNLQELLQDIKDYITAQD